MFDDFLQDSAAYDALCAEWSRRWSQIVRQASAERLWQPHWLDESDRDGNPLFTAWSPREGRGVRIIHYERGAGHPDFATWEDTVVTEGGTVREFVVASTPDRAQLDRVQARILQWILADETQQAVTSVSQPDGAGDA